MSLAGDLAVFSAYDVFQLLSLSRATGTLILRATGVRGAVYFQDGRIAGAVVRPNTRRLGSFLVEAGVVDEATLARAVASKIAGDRRVLGEILLAWGAVRPADLTAARTAQARSALAALLILPAGRFAFANNLLPPAMERELAGVDASELVFEALSRLDELRAGHLNREGHGKNPGQAKDPGTEGS